MFECLEFEECQYNAQPKCCLPDGVECPHGVKVHKPTNADRVRAMSDEYDLDRLRELVQAHKENRVLPEGSGWFVTCSGEKLTVVMDIEAARREQE